MPKTEGIQQSILIISASEQFDAIVKSSLKNFITIDTVKSGALARRRILERDYDIAVINAPLPDESGEELSCDLASDTNTSTLLVVPREVYEDVLEHVTDAGALVIPKPFPKGRIDKGIRFLTATRTQIRRLEKRVSALEDKLEEQKVVGRAKLLLMDKKGMNEDEAHRLIGKMAMDNGVSRRIAAMQIIDDLD